MSKMSTSTGTRSQGCGSAFILEDPDIAAFLNADPDPAAVLNADPDPA